MRYLLPVLLVLLAACSTAPIGETRHIAFSEVRKGLEHQTGASVHLEDLRYLTVSLADVQRAAMASWIPAGGSWDCDDHGAALCGELRRRYHLIGAQFPPACGTIEGRVDSGKLHCIVWGIRHDGAVFYFDPSRQCELRRDQLSNLAYASDK